MRQPLTGTFFSVSLPRSYPIHVPTLATNPPKIWEETPFLMGRNELTHSHLSTNLPTVKLHGSAVVIFVGTFLASEGLHYQALSNITR